MECGEYAGHTKDDHQSFVGIGPVMLLETRGSTWMERRGLLSDVSGRSVR